MTNRGPDLLAHTRNLRLQNQCPLPRQTTTAITRYTPANSCRTAVAVTLRCAHTVRLNLNLGLAWGLLDRPRPLGITDYSSRYFCSPLGRNPPRTPPHSPVLSVLKASQASNFTIHYPFFA